MKLLIRELRPTDLAAAVEIHTDPQTNIYNPCPPGKNEVEDFFMYWLHLTHAGKQAYRVAELDGKVAGFGGAVAKTNDLGFETYFNIYFRLAVQYHGYGLGRLLGQEGLNAASKAGVTALAITRINNQPSIKLIEKLGMQPYLCRLMDLGPPQQVYRIESTRR